MFQNVPLNLKICSLFNRTSVRLLMTGFFEIKFQNIEETFRTCFSELQSAHLKTVYSLNFQMAYHESSSEREHLYRLRRKNQKPNYCASIQWRN